MEDDSNPDVDVERLRRRVDAFRFQHDIPAIAVSIRRGAEQILAYDRGFASLGRRTPASPRTFYAIGSITKQFVAATALGLHARHSIDLETPLRDILASTRVGENVTLSHLLSHSSGIVYDVGTAVEPAPTLSSVLERIDEDARLPGAHWFYCNTNYYLAGHALQLMTGIPLSELVQLIVPADLRASFRFDEIPPGAFRADGHAHTPKGIGTAQPPDGRSFGSGSAYATATMLTDWASRLWSGDILSLEGARSMSRRTVLSDGGEVDYGVGCFSTRSVPNELSHDGNTAGFSSQAAYYPEARLAICVLANSQRHVAEELEKSLRDIVLGPPVSSRPVLATATQSRLEDLEGRYGLGPRRTGVTLCGAGLRLVSPGGRLVHLMRHHGDTFVDRAADGYEYDFGLHSAGRILQIRRGHKLLVVLPRES